ncbi:MAG TPA: glycoside hydrolase family 172 protein [Phycisphaerae bacterium]|nr:glycoside hydrolase family 172 protein [Phycisphaerae bacterium]
MTVATRGIVVFLAPVLLASAATAGDDKVKDYSFFLNRLIDLDGLAVLEDGIRTAQWSSYDRKSKYDEATGKYVDWDANGDSGHYIRVDEQTGEAVMAEIDGPGCIWRIWSANPKGKICFYLDGADKPTYEWDFNDLFDHNKSPFPSPLVWQRRVDLKDGDNPASNCYMPIPFARGCKVTADQAHRQYYHIGYSVFPKEWKVKTFTMERTPEEEATLKKVIESWTNRGQDPQPADGGRTIADTVDLKPGVPVTIGRLEGPGTIRQFLAKVIGPERWVHRKVVLQMYWDGQSRPAVEAPIGDFFGDAWADTPYRSLPMGITDEMSYCFFRMPFSAGAKIVATNQGRQSARLRFNISWQEGRPPAGAGRFHAGWRRDIDSSAFDYPVLECGGKGRFVGCVLFADNIVGGWWGEGDEKIHVDGEKFPSTFGTGSEDYFGDAWGIRYFENACHGYPRREPWDKIRRQACYRWHVSDSIPFEKSFRMTIENYAAVGKNTLKNDYSSMAYWYQAPGGSDFFASVPMEARVPQGPVRAGAIEAETALWIDIGSPGIRIIDDDSLFEPLSKGRGVLISGKSGTRAVFGIPVPQEGLYTLEAVIGGGVATSETVLMQDARPIDGPLPLPAGEVTVELKVTGQPVAGDCCEAIVDFFMLQPCRAFVREWYLIGPFDNTDKAGADKAYGPETDAFQAGRTYGGKGGGQVSWRKIRAREDSVNRGGDFFKQNEHVVIYAYSEAISPDDREVIGHAGSDDGIKVFVNGKCVHTSLKERGLKLDEDTFKVQLKQGRNAVLLKVLQIGGEWGFAFRLDDPKNELRYVLP